MNPMGLNVMIFLMKMKRNIIRRCVMKKGELKKCEGLMYDAIIKANNFKKNYAAYERLLKDGGKMLTQNVNYG